VWSWLLEHNADSDWLLALEDDSVPTADFNRQLEMVLDAGPTPVVSLYLGTSRPVWYQPQGQRSATKLQPLLRERVAQADVEGASFITAPQLFHGVAVAIRTELVPSMLDFTSMKDPKRPFDYAVSDWCENEDHTVAYAQPSIVDHEDGPSVAVHQDREPRLKPRKAYRLGGRQTWDGTRIVEL
jgi:hypothetical protein